MSAREPLENALEAAMERTNRARRALRAAKAELDAAQKAELQTDAALVRFDAQRELRGRK